MKTYEDGLAAARKDIVENGLMAAIDNEPLVTSENPSVRMAQTGYRIGIRLAVDAAMTEIESNY